MLVRLTFLIRSSCASSLAEQLRNEALAQDMVTE